jgi:ubiquinone/menaquinone biosynthesis C-methylase UbiE
MHYLRKFLPKRGLILDAGGGPGRYTIELAKMGYNVVLLDLTPSNLKFAERMIRRSKVDDKVEDMVEGNIVDLSMFPSNRFDAVVCLGGPISHVEGNSNRKKAISELVRVAKEGAPIFVSVFGRMGALILSVQYWPREIGLPSFKDFVDKGEDHLWHGKYYAHYFMPEEFKDLLALKNTNLLKIVGLEGIGMNAKYVNLFARRDKKGLENFIIAHDKLAAHPASVAMSVHMLGICKKL